MTVTMRAGLLSLTIALGSLLWIVAIEAKPASATKSLDRFFQQVSTYYAKFNQVVLDEALNPVQESSGELWIQRPGQFRWHYHQPYEQLIVGTGKEIWVYDVELKQATHRPMQGALGQTPALLLAGKGKIDKSFIVKPLGLQGQLDWVQMIPRNKDGGFEDIRIGFEKGRLRMLEMKDSFGQTTRVTLKSDIENRNIQSEKFKFVPPKGVDVVDQ